MQPIRFYLLILISKTWTSTVHRDLESLLDSWKIYSGRSDITAVVHVGLNRSEFEFYESFASNYPGRVLLSASARWVLLDVCKCAPLQVGLVEGTPLYLAIEGWGYSIQPEELELSETFPPSIIKDKNLILTRSKLSSQWLELLKSEHPGIHNIVNAHGVVDEESYWNIEHSLPKQIRNKIGIFRFYVLSEHESLDDITALLMCAPPWLYDLDIVHLGLSVRSYNALSAANVMNVADLSKLSTEDLLRIQNFGRGSLVNVAECLLKAIYPTFQQDDLPYVSSKTNVVNTSNLRGFTSEVQSVTVKFDVTATATSFQEAIELCLLTLDSKIAKIIKYRMGFESEPLTLQEIGDLFGFSRERSRQIEAKGIKKLSLNPVWEETFFPKLEQILEDRVDSITLSGLGIIDPWFIGVEKTLEPFKYVLERISNQGFYLINTNGQIFVTRISQEKWNEVCTVAINLLEIGVEQKWTLSEAKKQVGDLLPLKGNELRSELWIVTSRFAHFSTNESGEQFLVGIGRGAEVLVETVLAESSTPLHYSEIAKRIRDKYGKSIEDRRAHNAAQTKSLIYGRGTYGLDKHCPLSLDELNLVKSRCEELIFNGAESRQWSCAELSETLENEGLDFESRLNRYIVNIALSRSPLLSDLRRMVWTRSTNVSASAANRVDLSQAVESLLMSNGRPMSYVEIRDILQKERGLGETFQIHAAGSIIRVGHGKWGLIDRDLSINQTERNTLVQDIESLLRRSNKGIHLTEISKLISEVSVVASRIEDPTVFFTLAQRTGKMRISQGNYLFLPEWGGARRLSPNQAITTTILQAKTNGLRASELAQMASNLLGREIKKETVYSPLYAMGARFDEELGRWFPPKDGESDDDFE